MIVYNYHEIKACKNKQIKLCDYLDFQKHPETEYGLDLPYQWTRNTFHIK